jgi:hypothetical protein
LSGRGPAGSAPTTWAAGTFTVSNLGMLGVEQFTAVINPPEAAILTVGAAGWNSPCGSSPRTDCCRVVTFG